MTEADKLPRGVRVERFVPARAIPSAYRGEASEPGALAVACHTPHAWRVFVSGGLLLLTGAIAAWVRAVLVFPEFLVLPLLVGVIAVHQLVEAYRVRARLDLGARFVARRNADVMLDVASEEVRGLEAVEAPEKDDTTAWAIVVELTDGTHLPVMTRLRIDQARYVARLGRAALGLDGPSPPRVRVEGAEEPALRDAPSPPRAARRSPPRR